MELILQYKSRYVNRSKYLFTVTLIFVKHSCHVFRFHRSLTNYLRNIVLIHFICPPLHTLLFFIRCCHISGIQIVMNIWFSQTDFSHHRIWLSSFQFLPSCRILSHLFCCFFVIEMHFLSLSPLSLPLVKRHRFSECFFIVLCLFSCYPLLLIAFGTERRWHKFLFFLLPNLDLLSIFHHDLCIFWFPIFWSIWLSFYLHLIESSKFLQIIRLHILNSLPKSIPLDSCLTVRHHSTNRRWDIDHHIPCKLSLNGLLILVRHKNWSLVFCWRVVHSPSPKRPAHELPLIYISILEHHSAIMLKHTFEEIPTIHLLFRKCTTHSTRSFLLINKTNIARR